MRIRKKEVDRSRNEIFISHSHNNLKFSHQMKLILRSVMKITICPFTYNLYNDFKGLLAKIIFFRKHYENVSFKVFKQ
jgi:hypothetical protein